MSGSQMQTPRPRTARPTPGQTQPSVRHPPAPRNTLAQSPGLWQAGESTRDTGTLPSQGNRVIPVSSPGSALQASFTPSSVAAAERTATPATSLYLTLHPSNQTYSSHHHKWESIHDGGTEQLPSALNLGNLPTNGTARSQLRLWIRSLIELSAGGRTCCAHAVSWMAGMGDLRETQNKQTPEGFLTPSEPKDNPGFPGRQDFPFRSSSHRS
ncbi:hypothetical protein CONLIGDRAFT_649858 [Coniochaeta ligniaria NRRL 30616]|uniref:Uncharacterized protein n=1 Tax=Coniochaeta ligniaria NRRL 30616 TaxID=1408157 RepID=A0A1J7I6S7_9PEZI|nr:hypothetical protein CONLIGDRAFT_649858 [Coniochaeta ligniaria NRRL 30616]